MKSILICFFFCLPAFTFAEGKLDKIKKETKKEKKDKPSKNQHHNHHHHNSSSDDVVDSFLFELAWYTILSIYGIPHHYIDSGESASFSKYPYHPDELSQGYLTINEPDTSTFFSLHTSLESKFYADNVVGYGTHLNFYSAFRIDVLTDYTYLTENIDDDETSSLTLGSANLTIRFAQNEFIQMRSGLGINFLLDKESSTSGINFIYAIDLYPVKPIFFSLRFDGGALGSAGYARLRGLIGVTYKHFEINTGFELIGIGDESLNGVILGFKITF
ncbi:MAG: hypothetical protein COA79_07040 [Planctomycetota bacterium]|nr:MAG: hypothetical protein COA79_07040 [Planctomycetota bacterium]